MLVQDRRAEAEARHERTVRGDRSGALPRPGGRLDQGQAGHEENAPPHYMCQSILLIVFFYQRMKKTVN